MSALHSFTLPGDAAPLPRAAAARWWVRGGLLLAAAASAAIVAYEEYARPRLPLTGVLHAPGRDVRGAVIKLHALDANAATLLLPTARVDAAGRFALAAPIGTFAVTTELRPRLADGESIVWGDHRLPARFAHSNTTPWRVTVQRGAAAPLYLELVCQE